MIERMADRLFWWIVFELGSIILIFSGIGELCHAGFEQWGHYIYKKRRMGLIYFCSGFLLQMLCMHSMMAGVTPEINWLVLGSIGTFLLVPANEFDYIAWKQPYDKEKEIKKAKRIRNLFIVLFVVFELVLLRMLIGETLT